MSREVYDYKRSAIKTARELFYPDYVITKIKNAVTENEICRIMHTARQECCNY